MKRLLFSAIIIVAALNAPVAAAQGFENREVRAVITSEVIKTGEAAPQYSFTATTSEGDSYEISTLESYPEGFFIPLRQGQKVILQVFEYPDGTSNAALTDVVRIPALIWLFIFFAIVTVAVGFLRGFSALIGLAVTVGILFAYIFPQILAGADPVTVTVIGSIAILAVNMHLSHGFHKKTLVAFGGTVIGLLLVVVFAKAFVHIAMLSGLGSEESMFLFLGVNTITVPAGILLAGIIIGAVGVLDDIAIAQSEVVTELIEANNKLSRKELFTSAMRIGRHHIASTVNTLVLAYVGAALPLFLIFITASVSMGDFLNIELVAEEVVRTLAGTTALVLSVPICTALSVLAQQGKSKH